jgi:hypothetical protein
MMAVQTDSKAGATAPALAHRLTITRHTNRYTATDRLDRNIQLVIDSVVGVQRQRDGWTCRFENDNPQMVQDDIHFGRTMNNQPRIVSNRYDIEGSPDGIDTTGYDWTTDLRLECRPSRPRKTLDAEFANITAQLHTRLENKIDWRVIAIDGQPYIAVGEGKDESAEHDPDESVGYAPFVLPPWDEFKSHFTELYGMDDYIVTLYETLKTAVDSEWRIRCNFALIGPPACGKSQLMKCLANALLPGATLMMDGTSTTAAGALELLKAMAEMPRVLLSEELEKQDDKQTRWMLGMLDIRGEVKKLTTRTQIDRETHLIGICTVNDEHAFEKMNAGALASRYTIPLYFTRPHRNVMHKIVAREIGKLGDFTGRAKCEICERPTGGVHRWINPALDFAEDMNTSDPRRVIGFATLGRDGLLDKSYQDRMRKITRPDKRYDGVARAEDDEGGTE